MRNLHTLLEELYEKANLSEEERGEYRQRAAVAVIEWAVEMREDLAGEVSEFSASSRYRELAEKPGFTDGEGEPWYTVGERWNRGMA